jgi:hypothetical protein
MRAGVSVCERELSRSSSARRGCGHVLSGRTARKGAGQVWGKIKQVRWSWRRRLHSAGRLGGGAAALPRARCRRDGVSVVLPEAGGCSCPVTLFALSVCSLQRDERRFHLRSAPPSCLELQGSGVKFSGSHVPPLDLDFNTKVGLVHGFVT